MITCSMANAAEPKLEGGCIFFGGHLYEPWPSLAILPTRDTALGEEIIWARQGDRLWDYTSRIPGAVLRLIKQFPALRWSLLEFCAAGGAKGLAVIREAPALAVLIAQSRDKEFHDPGEYLRQMANGCWSEVALKLGLPTHRWVFRLLRKVPVAHCQPATVEAFATAIRERNRHVRTLRHAARITRDTIALLRRAPEVVSPKILFASGNSDNDEEPVSWLLGNILWFLHMEDNEAVWPYRHLDMDQLVQVEARLHQRYLERLGLGQPFPAAPLDGIPGQIEPIRDYASLILESDLQRNCARDYADEVVAGGYYLYAISVWERGTLAIRRCGESGRWIVDDLRGPNNEPPSYNTIRFVHEWLESGLKS